MATSRPLPDTKCAVEGAFMDLAAAFKHFFAGRKAGHNVGYPKFKSKKRSRQSFYLANDKFTVGDHWVDVPKLGRVNMADWWFVSITVEMPNAVPVKTNPPRWDRCRTQSACYLERWTAVRKPKTATPSLEQASPLE